MTDSMLIGYLQLPLPQEYEGGIARYGHHIATAVQQLGQFEVQEAVLELAVNKDFRPELQQALNYLQSCDVLHLQYSKYLELKGWQKLAFLKCIHQTFKGKLCITLHDVYSDLYPAYGIREAWALENKRMRGFSKNQSLALRSTAVSLWDNYLADRAIMQWIFNHCDQLLVCNQAEAERLKHFKGSENLTVIPHFVEPRSSQPSSLEAKAALGLEAQKIITLQGFIYRSKGYELLIDALSLLPDEYRVIFAGGMAPHQGAFQQELEQQINHLGLGDRVKMTGYLPEAELELHLAATDLAVCPFKVSSASGSLATWISIERPILAYKLPQIEELNNLVPGAISIFDDYSPEALAKAIQSCFKQDLSGQSSRSDFRIKPLKERLSLNKIAQEHGALYQGENIPRLTEADQS